MLNTCINKRTKLYSQQQSLVQLIREKVSLVLTITTIIVHQLVSIYTI